VRVSRSSGELRVSRSHQRITSAKASGVRFSIDQPIQRCSDCSQIRLPSGKEGTAA
jgi:hypothetical protein